MRDFKTLIQLDTLKNILPVVNVNTAAKNVMITERRREEVILISEVETLLRLSLEIAEQAESRVMTLEELQKIMDLRVVAARVGNHLKEQEGN